MADDREAGEAARRLNLLSHFHRRFHNAIREIVTLAQPSASTGATAAAYTGEDGQLHLDWLDAAKISGSVADMTWICVLRLWHQLQQH